MDKCFFFLKLNGWNYKNTQKNSPVVFHKQHLLRIQLSRRQEKRNQPVTVLLFSFMIFLEYLNKIKLSENIWKLKMCAIRCAVKPTYDWTSNSEFVCFIRTVLDSVCSLFGGFAHREKENVVWRFVFPCGGAAAKIIVKSDRRLAWNEIVMIIRFYESRLNSKDLLPFFLPDRFFFQILMEAGWKICALWSQLIKPHSTIDDALPWSTKVSNGSTSYFTT